MYLSVVLFVRRFEQMAQRYTRIHCLCLVCSMFRKCCRLICADLCLTRWAQTCILFMSMIMIMSMSMIMTILNIVTIISHLASSSIIEHLSASIRHVSSSAMKDQRRLQECYASSHVSVAFFGSGRGGITPTHRHHTNCSGSGMA